MRRRTLRARLVCSLLIFAVCSLAQSRSRRSALVVELTDLNFDEQLGNGRPWIIGMSAHYCPLTREIESAMEKAAVALQADEVSVGRVDGARQRGLLSRFQLRNLHGVFHVNGTSTRLYCDGHACEGTRLNTKQIVKYVRGGWQAEPPRTGCTSPVSRCGRAIGQVTKLPARVKHSYSYLHSERHYSDLTLLAGLLAVPVMLGLTCICLLDAVYCRPLPPPTPRPRPHFE